MRRLGRASTQGVRRLSSIPLALGAAAAIAACGGGGDHAAATHTTPATLLSQSVGNAAALRSGHLDATLSLTLDGVQQLQGKPITLELSGPFTRSGNSIATDLTLSIDAGSSHATLGLDVVGGAVYVGFGGRFYAVKGAASTGTRPSVGGGATGATGLLRRLGIDPKRWLTDPRVVGTADVGGVSTTHLSAQIDVAAVLDDLSKAITAGSGAGATGASGASGATSDVTSVLGVVDSAITSARADLYTGVSDHIPRKLDVAIDFTLPSIAAGVIDGLTGGSLNFDLTLTALGTPQTVTAPANPQSLDGLGALERRLGSFGGLLHQLGAAA